MDDELKTTSEPTDSKISSEPFERPLPPPNIVSREEWGAMPAVWVDTQRHPVPCVTLEHNTGVDHCFTKENCIKTVRLLQSRHMQELGEPDIQFNFLLGDDGNVYEGRGWNAQGSKSVNATKLTPHRYDFAFIGTHRCDYPPMNLFELTKRLLQYGIGNQYIKDDFELLEVTADGKLTRVFIGRLAPSSRVEVANHACGFGRGDCYQCVDIAYRGNYGNEQTDMVRILNIDQNGVIYFVSKVEWTGREATSLSPARGPFRYVNFTCTGTETCKNRADCEHVLKRVQVMHMASGASDIRYNFLVGGFGTVYEGRGWANLADHQSVNPMEYWDRLDIAYIGDYETRRQMIPGNYNPPFEVVASALSLVKYGLKNNYITPSFRIGYYMPLKYNAQPI